jgi:hypothetical protein
MADRGAVAAYMFEAARRDGERIRFETLLLPLMHTRQIVTRYIGSISAIDPPYWLGTEPVAPGPIIKRDIIWPDGRPHPVVARLNRQSPFLPAMQGARIVRQERRQFRVFEGGGTGSQDKR